MDTAIANGVRAEPMGSDHRSTLIKFRTERFPVARQPVLAVAPSFHRPFCRTTNIGVRDFSGMARPFVAPERSQLTTTTRIDRVTRGKGSTISTPRRIKKSIYINR